MIIVLVLVTYIHNMLYSDEPARLGSTNTRKKGHSSMTMIVA